MKTMNIDTGEGITSVSCFLGVPVDIILGGKRHLVVFSKSDLGGCVGCPLFSEYTGTCRIENSSYEIYHRMFSSDDGGPLYHNCISIEEDLE